MRILWFAIGFTFGVAATLLAATPAGNAPALPSVDALAGGPPHLIGQGAHGEEDVPGSPKDAEPDPVLPEVSRARGPRAERPTFPSALGVDGILSAIERLEATPDSWRHVGPLLHRLAWIGTKESSDALLALFRSRKHIQGLFGTWASLLGNMDAPEAEKELREYLAGRVRHEFREPGDATPLWRALSKYGNMDGEFVDLLTSNGLHPLSTSRCEIIDAIDGPVSAELRDVLTTQLKGGPRNASVCSAFRALMRLGDEAAVRAAEEYMLTGLHGPRLAVEYGRQMNSTKAQELRGQAYGNPQVLSVYLAATSASPPAVRASERAALEALTIKSLKYYDDESDPERTHRQAVVGAVQRLAVELASLELLDAVVGYIDRSPARANVLIDVVNTMRDELNLTRSRLR